MLGRRRLRRDDVRGMLAPSPPRPRTPATTVLVLTDGRQRVRLVSGLWVEGDLAQIVAELRVPTSDRPLRPAELEAAAPGATTAHDRHPWWTAAVVAGIILALATVAAVLLVLFVPPDAPRPASPRTPSPTRPG